MPRVDGENGWVGPVPNIHVNIIYCTLYTNYNAFITRLLKRERQAAETAHRVCVNDEVSLLIVSIAKVTLNDNLVQRRPSGREIKTYGAHQNGVLVM
jgi:hypothetical protein